MEEYYCEPCGYHTNRLYNFKDHLKSQKHSENSDVKYDENTELKKFKVKIWCCKNPNCTKIYTRQSSLINHSKTCNEKLAAEFVAKLAKKSIAKTITKTIAKTIAKNTDNNKVNNSKVDNSKADNVSDIKVVKTKKATIPMSLRRKIWDH